MKTMTQTLNQTITLDSLVRSEAITAKQNQSVRSGVRAGGKYDARY